MFCRFTNDNVCIDIRNIIVYLDWGQNGYSRLLFMVRALILRMRVVEQ